MSHVRGRYIPVLEQEMRRAVKEPVAVWRQEWVLPASSAGGVAADAAAASGSTKNDGGLKILKWVKTNATAEFPEEEDQEYAGPMDLDPVAAGSAPAVTVAAAAPLAPVETAASLTGGAAGGLGSIAPPVDASALSTAADTDATAANSGEASSAAPHAAAPTVASAIPPHISGIDSLPVSGTVTPSASSAAEADTSGSALPPSSLDPSQSQSRDETPQAHPQVAGELHPPPSGLSYEDHQATAATEQPQAEDGDDSGGSGSGAAARMAGGEQGNTEREAEAALPPSADAKVEDIETRGVVSIEPGTDVRHADDILDTEARVQEVGSENTVGQGPGDGDVSMADV
ncbi:uncharacterized protein PFL1_03369 [Pseudozyma flocculosa PF-1]|uniref:Uncharacterized protein n=2 Tax=Pseudozyma flocculosa TaxID=84751 RepID=A0A5C3F6C3_9BASI|nr:uncharacterized protein PFL1_03369 [Pseudozyma flocculosa PF-1]EPQ29080.1 hypothetical protein PFL1_03369 [Pseudozyma flocculosa PF-1]SPO40074.1 uncharacterized protein PSFLO_05556 [Pseudozyma flocculosa]